MKGLITFLLLALLTSASAQNQGSFFTLYTRPATGSYDTDAQAYFTASGLTDATAKAAVDTLVRQLKDSSLWTLGALINPLPGTSSTINAVNLKTPGTYNLTYTGTITHNANGITPNGSTGFANTNLNPNTVFPGNFYSFGVYSRSGTAGAFGHGATVGTNRTQLYPYFGNTFYGQLSTNNSIAETMTSLSAAAWFYVCRTGSTAIHIQRNLTQAAFTTTTIAVNANLYVGAINNGGSATGFTDANIAFIWVGAALTTAQSLTLYRIIQAYETRLSRNI